METYGEENISTKIPPKHPDKITQPNLSNPSYKEKLLQDKVLSVNPHNDIISSPMDTKILDEDARVEGDSSKDLKQIILTDVDKQRIYEPWKYSVIIKLMGKRLMQHNLKKKIQDL